MCPNDKVVLVLDTIFLNLNPTKRISVVIFDCDGVMFDSRQANINYYNHVLSYFGLPSMTREEADFVHMHTADQSIEHIFRGTSYAEKAQSYRMKIDYAPFIKDMVMEPGLKELLALLKPQYGLAVATNRGDTIAEVLRSNGISDFFDIVISSLDVQKPKPDPESIYKILDFYKISSRQALYVGDSLIDCETAKAAGVAFVSYKNESLDTPWKVEEMIEIVGVIRALSNPQSPESNMQSKLHSKPGY
ncbi:HAD hydrolase, family IA, variant 3 [uncultured Desulfobacterium sp.]|uniref:phosphoglycolate phosphatase n=1 Tax=uncultured Desulfobacterium sp. TaxID=201089 RepID=A0A445MX61_9BACT|nr:HAD hydrolase, family IA, variant 3 [uncultured Desulfobacterium sp.]